MAKHVTYLGAVESTGAAQSYVDVAGGYMDYDGATYAQFGAKGPGSLGVKIRTVLAGVALTALTFAAAGGATFVGSVASAGLSVTGPSSGATVSTLTAFDTNTTPLLVFQRSGGAVAGKLAYNNSATAMEFGTTTTHDLRFITNNALAVTITSGGTLAASGGITGTTLVLSSSSTSPAFNSSLSNTAQILIRNAGAQNLLYLTSLNNFLGSGAVSDSAIGVFGSLSFFPGNGGTSALRLNADASATFGGAVTTAFGLSMGNSAISNATSIGLSGAVTRSANGVALDGSSAAGLALVNNATSNLRTTPTRGLLVIYEKDFYGSAAVYLLSNTFVTLVAQRAEAGISFTATKDTASALNVYYEAGNIVVQNKGTGNTAGLQHQILQVG